MAYVVVVRTRRNRHQTSRHIALNKESVRPSNVVDHPPRSQAPAPNRRVAPAQHRPSLQASRQHAQRNTVGPSRPLRPALAADSRQGQQRPPPKKAPCQGEENRVGWMTPTDVLSVVQEPSGTSGISSRGCPRRMRWPRQKSQDRRHQETGRLPKGRVVRSHRQPTPPKGCARRSQLLKDRAQQTLLEQSTGLQRKEGRQEARDERPSTSKAAAAAEPTARESTSSAPTKPRTSYAAVASPSDALEDLAEDEDLADLTLDPAAVEEIDEQMAMSSQELHEKLEGADVTLTPCDDEGNSRPSLSCDMEPLL
ncbi:hypothetical protein ACLKA6_013503 [Drosophila palustris]